MKLISRDALVEVYKPAAYAQICGSKHDSTGSWLIKLQVRNRGGSARKCPYADVYGFFILGSFLYAGFSAGLDDNYTLRECVMRMNDDSPTLVWFVRASRNQLKINLTHDYHEAVEKVGEPIYVTHNATVARGGPRADAGLMTAPKRIIGVPQCGQGKPAFSECLFPPA